MWLRNKLWKIKINILLKKGRVSFYCACVVAIFRKFEWVHFGFSLRFVFLSLTGYYTFSAAMYSKRGKENCNYMRFIFTPIRGIHTGIRLNDTIVIQVLCVIYTTFADAKKSCSRIHIFVSFFSFCEGNLLLQIANCYQMLT